MTERIILKGRSELLKPLISEVLAIHQLIDNRDIGQIIGSTLEENVRPNPQSLKIGIIFYSVPSPPWKASSDKKLTKVTYNIPSVKRTLINWDQIKLACGGKNGYMWGRFRCTANLDNGRQMQVYAGSESEAEERLKALLTFSEASIVTLTIAEEKKEGVRASNKLLYKESIRVYPAYMTVINQQKVVTESNVPTLSGNYTRSRNRIPLWTSTKPVGTDQIIQEAVRIRGSNTVTTS